ncbi:MltR family transcriptional regulator [Conservatibacter flavescens]|uniref:MltR family transcriptional regulator n=1 Tax=Conservatibacter flavescens TaxID=28161 RepID=A0A2M8S3M4_9PAST|nr:MltR family transcriptional regulator [Conservatibacter flavescens]PJG85707.1 MltR family transcriptional regulator [Conservatibacter flavescens]
MFQDENLIYEKLNDATSIRGFIISAVSLFEESVDQLINRVFLKTDFAVKSVVDSLLYQSGPLFELPIRLKVLLGLGVISHDVFEDINAFLSMKEQLNNDEKDYTFNDDNIISFTQNLCHQKDKPLITITNTSMDNHDSLQHQMHLLRQEKIIRSSLILIISEIYEQLQIESPL